MGGLTGAGDQARQRRRNERTSRHGSILTVAAPDGRPSAEAFIAANTRALAPPLVPEILLHLAEESLPIWQKTEEQLGEMNVPPPYWAFAWAGGQALARYILDNPLLLAGKRVLDLGSGSGLTAIAAMQAGAASVLAADIDRMALSAIRAQRGAERRRGGDDRRRSPRQAPAGPYDVVLVGDLFYERGLAELVLRFIDAAAAAGCARPHRRPAAQLFPQGALCRRRRVPRAGDARIGGRRDQAHAVWRLG